MNRRQSLAALGPFLVGPSYVRAFDPYFDLPHSNLPTAARGSHGAPRHDLLPPRDPLQRAYCRLAMFDDHPLALLHYQSALLGPDGQTWAGPKVLDCQRDPRNLTIHFTLQDLEAREPFSTSGIRLFHPDGRWRNDSPWAGGTQYLLPGDTLHSQLSFAINIA